MSREIDNSMGIIDSRDIIARIEELSDERDSMETPEDRAEWMEEHGAELKALEDLADEAQSSPDWQYGEGLIRDSYFIDYAQALAEDCGMIPNNLSWPCTCIDWEQAARELKQDYFSVNFDGVFYWIRA